MDPSIKRKLTQWTAQEKQDVVADYVQLKEKNPSLKLTEYCKSVRIPISTLHDWLRIEGRSAKKPEIRVQNLFDMIQEQKAKEVEKEPIVVAPEPKISKPVKIKTVFGSAPKPPKTPTAVQVSSLKEQIFYLEQEIKSLNSKASDTKAMLKDVDKAVDDTEFAFREFSYAIKKIKNLLKVWQ